MISRIVFQLDVKKPFFIVAKMAGKAFLFGHKTHLRLEVKLLELSYLTMRTFATQKLNQSAAHFTEPKSELTRSISKLPLKPWQCFFVQFVFLNRDHYGQEAREESE